MTADCLVEVVVRKSSDGSVFMVHGPWFMVDYLVGPLAGWPSDQSSWFDCWPQPYHTRRYVTKQRPPIEHTKQIWTRCQLTADCLGKVVHRKSNDILNQKTQSLPQAIRKVILRSAWQAQQRSMERPVATPMTIEPRVDVRFQRVPPEEPQEVREDSRETCIARVVQAMMSHPDKIN